MLTALKGLAEVPLQPEESAEAGDQAALLRLRLLTSRKVAVTATVQFRDDDALRKAREDFFRRVAGEALREHRSR